MYGHSLDESKNRIRRSRYKTSHIKAYSVQVRGILYVPEGIFKIAVKKEFVQKSLGNECFQGFSVVAGARFELTTFGL